jgi:large subunit ribosomal protein L25
MVFSFSAKKRAVGEGEALRAARQLPGVLYGPGLDPVSLSVDYNSFMKLFEAAGESSLIDLDIDGGAPVKVLIQALQQDPVKGTITHVDFRQINMNKEMHATLELNFVGEAPAVKALSGTLVKTQDTLDIKCLPKDLVSEINVDLSVLATFEDAIHVKDLVMPAGITAVEDEHQLIAKVTPPLTEDQLKAMEETNVPSVDQVEVEKKGKEEVAGEAGAGDKKDEGKKDEKK